MRKPCRKQGSEYSQRDPALRRGWFGEQQKREYGAQKRRQQAGASSRQKRGQGNRRIKQEEWSPRLLFDQRQPQRARHHDERQGEDVSENRRAVVQLGPQYDRHGATARFAGWYLRYYWYHFRDLVIIGTASLRCK